MWFLMQMNFYMMTSFFMRMLRWMCGQTRMDGIRNAVFQERLGVTCIVDKIKEGRLRCFGHVKRRNMTSPVITVENSLLRDEGAEEGPK